jgi:type II secretory pathway pseudopilin PulG
LVEVLAALVILGIVFVGILTVFPQMTLFNEKTETKLDTMNLARQEMQKFISANNSEGSLNFDLYKTNLSVEFSATEYKYLDELEKSEMLNKLSTKLTIDENKKHYDLIKNGDFLYVFQTNKIAELNESKMTGQTSIYKVILSIFVIENSDIKNLSSETYGYLEYKNK